MPARPQQLLLPPLRGRQSVPPPHLKGVSLSLWHLEILTRGHCAHNLIFLPGPAPAQSQMGLAVLKHP